MVLILLIYSRQTVNDMKPSTLLYPFLDIAFCFMAIICLFELACIPFTVCLGDGLTDRM